MEEFFVAQHDVPPKHPNGHTLMLDLFLCDIMSRKLHWTVASHGAETDLIASARRSYQFHQPRQHSRRPQMCLLSLWPPGACS